MFVSTRSRTKSICVSLVPVWLTLAAVVSLAQQPELEPSEEPAPRPTIELAPDPEQDEAISRRLGQIYGAIDGLGGLTVSTEAGVVTLGGEVEGPRLRATAEELAAALEGVVAVENDIGAAAEVDTRVRSVVDELQSRVTGWIRLLPLWLIAFAIVVLSWYAGATLGRVAVRGLRDARNPFVAELVRQAVRLAAGLAGLMLALLLLDSGPVIGSLIGSLGLIGLAIGFAVRDTIENYLASVLLSIRQPFKPNDLVAIDGREGRVLRLNSRATLLMDLDGNHVRIPNALVYKATIINYDRNPVRRFSFRVGVDPAAPLARVLTVAEQALAATPGTLPRPAPMAIVEAFGDAVTDITCFAWVNQQHVDLAKTRGAAMVALQAAFAEAGIERPVPRHAVSLTRQGAGAAAADIAPAAVEAEHVDVSRDDQTEALRAQDAGQNLLAEDGRIE